MLSCLQVSRLFFSSFLVEKMALTLESGTQNSELLGRDFSAPPRSEKVCAFQMSETRCGEMVERRA